MQSMQSSSYAPSCSYTLPTRSAHQQPHHSRRQHQRSSSPSSALTRLSQQHRAAASRLVANSATLTRGPQTSLPELNIQQPAGTADKVGVLLLNLGGPETLDDVEHFLFNLFNDPDIIRLPGQAKFLQPLLAYTLSKLRAPKSSEGYKAIGGGSPLRRITDEQAAALSDALKRKGQNADVYVAMRYWYPFTEEALEKIKEDNVTRLVVLPLYPQFSISTSGSSLRLLEESFKNDPKLQQLPHTVIASWYQRRGYVTAMADLIQQSLQQFQEQDSVEIFFSAHGVPVSYVEEAGDPYKEEMEQCISLIMQELQRRRISNHHTLAYQSRVGPVQWLQPYTDVTIRELGANGVKSLLAVPVSFVSEHIETLEEIDMEYRELAHESGIQNWGRVPALNTNPVFIDDLAEAVLEALPYVGLMAGSNPSDAMVPLGDVQSLLETYDRDRRVLPPPVVPWKWGWTKSAETWNGRIAMLAIVVILMLEVTTGHGVLNHWPYDQFNN
ncbi:TPA: Ferrochelatase-2, chloroplastic [Trebouxia sp. C0006]